MRAGAKPEKSLSRQFPVSIFSFPVFIRTHAFHPRFRIAAPP
jgi:hypothetical protein